MQSFELCRRFGIRVHEVVGLDEDSIYVPESRVAFIRADLPPGRRQEEAEWILCEALTDATSLDQT